MDVIDRILVEIEEARRQARIKRAERLAMLPAERVEAAIRELLAKQEVERAPKGP